MHSRPKNINTLSHTNNDSSEFQYCWLPVGLVPSRGRPQRHGETSSQFYSARYRQVGALVSKGDRREVDAATDELGRYFEWIKDDFPPDLRARLHREICLVQQTATGNRSK